MSHSGIRANSHLTNLNSGKASTPVDMTSNYG